VDAQRPGGATEGEGSDDELLQRQERNGPNQLEQASGPSRLRILLNQVGNPLIPILAVGRAAPPAVLVVTGGLARSLAGEPFTRRVRSHRGPRVPPSGHRAAHSSLCGSLSTSRLEGRRTSAEGAATDSPARDLRNRARSSSS
jgi:hypothetical protein